MTTARSRSLRALTPGLLVSGAVAFAATPTIENPKSKIQNLHPIPAGTYAPLQRTLKESAVVPVASFLLAEHPVTNAEFLAFVTAHPQWR
eukprot:gene14864-18155_t